MSEAFDKFQDPFAPPKEPCLVCCIHCGSTYDSWRIIWRDMPGEVISGAWCCPIPGCDGVGFQFDIHPVDPNWKNPDADGPSGMSFSLEEEDDLDCDEDEDEFDDDEIDWSMSDAFEDEDEDEDDEIDFAMPIDEFEADAFWIDPARIAPRRYGNTPQPPFNREPHDQFDPSDIPTKDDDIPF